MSSLDPQAQKRLYGTTSNVSSTTNLLPPSAAPSRGPTGVQAALAQGSALRSQASHASLNDSSPYGAAARGGKASSIAPSISDKFSLSPDPSSWDMALNQQEPDDYLHNPDPKRDRKNDKGGSIFTVRGFMNLGCLFILAAGIITLFAGYPLITYFTKNDALTFGAFNIGGTNASGQIPMMTGNWGLIDKDTPKDAYTYPSHQYNQEDWQLVYSDEFNVAGRTFYPGDDPFWEAVDLHYWGTNNMEWYSPEAITTKDGFLEVTLSEKVNHGMQWQGGMMSTWNKFCFTGGTIVTSVRLPGANNIVGLWPAIWTMGNLGRAGFGASLDGMWPYSYDACDVGTVSNQTVNGLPVGATINGDAGQGGILSFLPGQRLSRCTCPGESHPGPMHADGTYVGRAAPEIDIFEAQVGEGQGHVSMSCQWAPFNYHYEWHNETNLEIYNETRTHLNSYTGGAFQQATSCVVQTAQECYEQEEGCFSVYGFEYKPGFDDAYITWIENGTAAWTLLANGMAADPRVEIDARPIPQEPLYIIINLGMSRNFGDVDLDHLMFPTSMSVDWVRVYQPPDSINIGCDPKDFPTAAYIEQYIEAYTNPNLTTWVDDYKQEIPKNKWLGEC